MLRLVKHLRLVHQVSQKKTRYCSHSNNLLKEEISAKARLDSGTVVYSHVFAIFFHATQIENTGWRISKNQCNIQAFPRAAHCAQVFLVNETAFYEQQATHNSNLSFFYTVFAFIIIHETCHEIASISFSLLSEYYVIRTMSTY